MRVRGSDLETVLRSVAVPVLWGLKPGLAWPCQGRVSILLRIREVALLSLSLSDNLISRLWRTLIFFCADSGP